MGEEQRNAKLQGGDPTPVDRVLQVFGAKRTAQIVDLSTEAIRKWGQRGGRIPSRHQGQLLEAAAREGLPLTAADLVA